MKFKDIHIKELIILLVVLILLKWGINFIYEEGYFSPKNVKYSFTTMQMTNIDTAQLSSFIENVTDNDVILIYMGRRTCPVCVELLPKINSIFKENKKLTTGEVIQQYYFDSEKYKSEESKALRESIKANYVPSIILIAYGEVLVFDADDIQEENFSSEISALIN